MDKKQIREYLAEEGYRPELQAGILVFKHEGRHCVIETDDDDELYLRVILPNFWKIESENERQQVLEAADHVTRKIKVVKVFTVPNENTWAAIELFLPNEEAFRPILHRCMSALRAGVDLFVEAMGTKVSSQERD